ncbi:MAG: BON domain-containing protein [Gammaproteobacteria bacterium]|nr:BON domain-containing protein [Gammaproteobacteria bacterium]
MKLFTKTTFNAAVVAGALALTAGPASAFIPSEVPGISGGNANVVVNDGVATLFGTLDSNHERKLAEKFVMKKYDVEKVINLITTE